MSGPKGAWMTGVSRGLNIRSSMKRSIQSVALDSLSCSSSEGHPTVNFFFQYYCFIMVLTMHSGGTHQSASQALLLPA